MAPLRIGVLGAADIAPRALIDPAQDNPDTVVAAVAARNLDRARSYAAEHGIPTALDSYDELLASDDIDAVYIPTPNGLHGRWTRAAIAAGKHVLCEKPFAANADEADAVAAVAAESDVVVMEAFHNLYHPVTQYMADVIASGELGSIRSIDADFAFSIPDQPDNVRWSLPLAGGSLMDVGCYPLRLLRALGTGEPRVVSATATDFSPDVDGSMVISLEFPDGVSGTASCSMMSEASMSATVTGELGTLVSSHPFLPHEGNEFTITTTEGTRVETVTNESTYAYQLRAFVDAIQSGTPIVSDAQDAVATMSLIDDAYRASGLPLRQPTQV